MSMSMQTSHLSRTPNDIQKYKNIEIIENSGVSCFVMNYCGKFDYDEKDYLFGKNVTFDETIMKFVVIHACLN